jgi:Fur family ferric uptake transcriptional regulator
MPYTTPQKTAIYDVVNAARLPLTPSEICSLAQKKFPSLGIATVYRALKQFVQEGQVRVVEIPGIAPHYESTGRQHHHFFFCKQCKHLSNLLGCIRGINQLAPRGFTVDRHEIVLYGNCAECNAS